MKKFIVLSALVAATSTAFVACSSDDDLAQQPKAPETIVENGSSEGTPFSVLPSSDVTRADRYGASAWDGTNDTYVNCFKLYGKQADLTAWMKNVVFTRSSKSAAWTAARDDDGAVASLNWPKDNTETPLVKESEVATDFYAITDNAISTTDNSLTGVSSWVTLSQTTDEPPVNIGSFTYTLQTTHASIPWEDTGNPGDLISTDVTFVDPAKMRDLMYATTSKMESETTDGALPLQFHHALAGLTIQAKFLSNSDYGNGGYAVVKAVAICGLKTVGTFTMTPSTGLGAWSDQATKYNYYYELPTPIQIDAQDDLNASVVANPTIKNLVPAGEWLMIPQTTTPWNFSYNNGNLPNATTYTYIVVKLADKQQLAKDFFLCFPLNTTFNAGKNRVITIDIAQGRFCPFNFTDENYCDVFYEPSSVFGGSRPFEMDGEEF